MVLGDGPGFFNSMKTPFISCNMAQSCATKLLDISSIKPIT